MGANDTCTQSESTMTSVDAFRAQVEATFAILTDGLPTARIFVASISDVRRLWEVDKDGFVARAA